MRIVRSLLAALVMGACVPGPPSRLPPEDVRPTPPASYLAAKRIAEDRILPGLEDPVFGMDHFEADRACANIAKTTNCDAGPELRLLLP